MNPTDKQRLRRNIIFYSIVLTGALAIVLAALRKVDATHPWHQHIGELDEPGFRYSGEMTDSIPDGYGSAIYADGGRYYGFWSMGKRQGLGKMELPDGTLRFGVWEQDTLPKVKGALYSPGDHIYGIDVSNHQSKIAWENMELYADSTGIVHDNLHSSPFLQPVMFAVIKSTEGADWVAESYASNYRDAKICGITAGAYHFMRLSDIEEQIKNFITHTHLEPGDLPPVLDIELPNREMRRHAAKAVAYAHRWLQAMERHYGVKPILYTYDSYYNSYLKGKGFEKYDFFIARYNPEESPRVPHLEIWQFSEHGKAGGIKKYVDLDAFQGDYADFLHYLQRNAIRSSFHPAS